MSREKGRLRWLGDWMKTGLKVFLTLLSGLRGLEEGSGRGTDGEGIQRGAESGVQTCMLAPLPPVLLQACQGKQRRLRSCWLGAAAVQCGRTGRGCRAPETAASTTLPFPLPHVAPVLFSGGSAAHLPFDTWPFRFCLVTVEGAFQLPRNVPSRRGEQKRRVL